MPLLYVDNLANFGQNFEALVGKSCSGQFLKTLTRCIPDVMAFLASKLSLAFL